jgi:hypothetical protein
VNSDLHSATQALTEPPQSRFDAYSKAGGDISQATQNGRGVVLRVSPSSEDHAALRTPSAL